jgi:hypothetical protein
LPTRVTAYLGSDDGITVWLNGRKILEKDVYHPCMPDQERVELDLNAGDNQLLLKISNGVLDAGFYFSLRPGGNAATALDPLWERLRSDFPDAVRSIAWLRGDSIYGAQPLHSRYDDPRVRFDGKWQYVVVNGAPTYGLQSDEAGAKVELDFVGTSVDLLHRAGTLGQWGVIYEDTGRPFGLAGVEIDGRPVPALRDAVTASPDGRAVIDTSRNDGRTPLARNLPPG